VRIQPAREDEHSTGADTQPAKAPQTPPNKAPSGRHFTHKTREDPNVSERRLCPASALASRRRIGTPDTVRGAMTIKASPWGRAALGTTVVSAVGYATQTALDYVSKPDIIGQLVYFGLFAGFAIAAFVTGVVAVVTGRHRRDHTVRLGLIAIGYVVLAQTIQSLWD
jgi:hypothetical protein